MSTNYSPADTDTAIHEAGHAVAHVRLGIAQHRVTIDRQADTLGAVTAEGAGHVWDAASAVDQVIAYCAGYAALAAAGRDHATALAGADDDFEHADDLIGFWGLDADLEAWKARAVALMADPLNVAAVQAVAGRLLADRTIDADIIDLLVDLSDGTIDQADLDRYLSLRAAARV